MQDAGYINNVICFQNERGGTVKLAHITAPQSDFGGPEGKGDALHAMELALSFEKLNFQKLKELHSIADKNDDAQMADFVEDMLEEQVCFRLMMLFCAADVLPVLAPLLTCLGL